MFVTRPPPSPPTLYLPPPTSPSSILSAFRAAARSPSTSTHPVLIARAFASAHRHVITSTECSSSDSCTRLLKTVIAAAEYRAPSELQVSSNSFSLPFCRCPPLIARLFSIALCHSRPSPLPPLPDLRQRLSHVFLRRRVARSAWRLLRGQGGRSGARLKVTHTPYFITKHRSCINHLLLACRT
jgi:hypothetical protein